MKQYSDIEQMKSFLKEGERLDDLERNSYFISRIPKNSVLGWTLCFFQALHL